MTWSGESGPETVLVFQPDETLGFGGPWLRLESSGGELV